MQLEQVRLEVVSERPVVRNDQVSDIDLVVDLMTSVSSGKRTSSSAINLCIVLDRSGSMQGNKLEQAKKSCLDIYASLNKGDNLCVLAFDTEVVSVVNPQTPEVQIKDRISAIQAGGPTNLSNGWYLALLEAQTYGTDNHINRIILLSDGQANQGEQKSSVLGAESSRAREELNITTSTIGIGQDFHEDLLAALAQESGGRFWFIGEARIEDIIKEEFKGALSILLERPKVELEFPQGVSVIKELNTLRKVSNRYSIRPMKANDQFCFAMRIRVDPALVEGGSLQIKARLFDGAEKVNESEITLSIGSLEEFVQSAEDQRVAKIVSKYLLATSDEKIAGEIDTGNVTNMLEMLQSQSDLMKKIEEKLGGESIVTWEEMTERDKMEAERQRIQREKELEHLRDEIAENESLLAVGQLFDFLSGLGQSHQVEDLLFHCRKMYTHRSSRKHSYVERGEMDDWATEKLLRSSMETIDVLINDNPSYKNELTNIRTKINEQLAFFS